MHSETVENCTESPTDIHMVNNLTCFRFESFCRRSISHFNIILISIGPFCKSLQRIWKKRENPNFPVTQIARNSHPCFCPRHRVTREQPKQFRTFGHLRGSILGSDQVMSNLSLFINLKKWISRLSHGICG